MIGLSILSSAAAARSGLTPEAREQMLSFFRSRQTQEGGFWGRSRSEKGDLYYSFFGLAGLLALGADRQILRPTANWFESRSREAPELDPIHRICLAQGRAVARRRKILPWLLRSGGAADRLAAPQPGTASKALLRWSAPFSTAEKAALLDHLPPEARQTSADKERWPELYLLFLRTQLYESLGTELSRIPVGETLADCACPDGGYGSTPGMARGVTSATSAALVLQARTGRTPDATAIQWLLDRRDAEGGFVGAPDAPLADLLSTAVALFALTYLRHPLDSEDCAATEEYVSAHWNEDGGFCGTVLDPDSDVEYSFYGLLALGCLKQLQKQNAKN